MKTISLLILAITITGCIPFGPRKVNWGKEWRKWNPELKQLASKIEGAPDSYKAGNHDFPPNFKYPFDQGFHINKNDGTLTITFYLDRGVLHHFSAFIYTTSDSKISELNSEVKNGGYNFNLGDNWYIINH